jgi:hypothetical protein
MLRESKAGILILVVSLVGFGMIVGAYIFLPDKWDGPNIGGGCLSMLFLAGAITGAALVVKGKRRNRPNWPA